MASPATLPGSLRTTCPPSNEESRAPLASKWRSMKSPSCKYPPAITRPKPSMAEEEILSGLVQLPIWYNAVPPSPKVGSMFPGFRAAACDTPLLLTAVTAIASQKRLS